MHERATAAQASSAWERWPDANVAVVTGTVSGVGVLDVDPRSGGDETLGRLEQRWGALPSTVEAHSGGGGRHVWFGVEGEVPSAVLGPGLELKAERGIVIAPPSVHASGARYAWRPGRSPDEVVLAPLPAWLETLSHGDPEAGSRHPLADPPVRTTGEQEEFAAAWERAGVVLRAGDHYYLCPFHPDTRPSLHVDADGCRWFCFGCRRGGGLGRLLGLLGEPARPVERARRRGHVGEPRPVELERGFDDPVETLVVRVSIGGRGVGRLQLEDAERLRAAVEEAVSHHGRATCHARIRGGWDRGRDDVGLFGVVVLLPEA
jgi:hypothetical protein